MRRLPNFRGYNERLGFEMGEAFGQARTLSALHECVETYLARLCQAEHVALCMAPPERPLQWEWVTRTLGGLLGDYATWAHEDFVGRAVMARRNLNRPLSDVHMLRGRKLEDTETWRRSREHGMKLRHVLSVAIVPGFGAGNGGVTLYSERRKPFSEEQRFILQQVVPSIQRIFRDLSRPRERVLRDDWNRRLTERERELVSLLLLRPGTNQEFAEELGLTENTVKDHFKSIYRKTGADGREDLIIRGQRLE